MSTSIPTSDFAWTVTVLCADGMSCFGCFCLLDCCGLHLKSVRLLSPQEKCQQTPPLQ